MIYMGRYDSPLGPITLAGEDGALTGLWFDGQKYFGAGLPAGTPEGEPPVFRQVRAWLDRYFRGEDPGPAPPLAPAGTAFQRAVWGGPAGDPLRPDGHLRPGGPGGWPRAGAEHLPPGGGERRGPQPHLPSDPLPPGGGGRRQPHRLRRGPGAEGGVAEAGERGNFS